MDFEKVLFRAKSGDRQSIEQILEMYQSLLIKNALVDGVFDEELYQELTLEVIKSIYKFQVIR